ncbi:MAG: peptidylprolyl isomerase [Alphaproteobacteria bacterium]|nr:peptidylprolyl isomerase [Alphaproteobacteria bacterium]
MLFRRSALIHRVIVTVGFCVVTALSVSALQTDAWGATKEPRTMRAAAVVNDIIISTYDLDQRIKLVMVTSGAQGPEAEKRLRPQVLRQLVDELLQLQEAQKFNVKITQEELEKNFKRISQQNNISVDQINKMLDDNGISRSTLQNQMKADLAWQKLVQQRLAPRVTVSDDEVYAVFDQMQQAARSTQYLVSEIFLAVDGPEVEDQVKQNIQSILGQLRSGATFSAIARQFSQSASASAGGDIGWVGESDMVAPVATAVKSMSLGGISEPIRAQGGYYVVGLREKRLALGSKVNSTVEAPPKPQTARKMASTISLGRIAIALAENASKAKQDQIRQASIEIYRSVNGCSSAGAVAKSHGGKFDMIGPMNVKDVAPQFRKILEETPNGRSTPPLRGATGVEMFVICSGGMVPAAQVGGGPAPTPKAATEVTKEEVESRLYNQELSMLARRYLRDLRRDATIEMRDN